MTYGLHFVCNTGQMEPRPLLRGGRNLASLPKSPLMAGASLNNFRRDGDARFEQPQEGMAYLHPPALSHPQSALHSLANPRLRCRSGFPAARPVPRMISFAAPRPPSRVKRSWAPMQASLAAPPPSSAVSFAMCALPLSKSKVAVSIRLSSRASLPKDDLGCGSEATVKDKELLGTNSGLLSGTSVLQRNLIRNLRFVAQQVQGCGVDLTLARIRSWTSAASVDFDNSRRCGAQTTIVPLDKREGRKLDPGAYLVEFNETVSVPLDFMGQIFARSSLWRSGATLTAGVVDAGYEGPLGALLDVRNPEGILVYKDARLGQIVFYQMEGKVKGYDGVYQGAKGVEGRDGRAQGE